MDFDLADLQAGISDCFPACGGSEATMPGRLVKTFPSQGEAVDVTDMRHLGARRSAFLGHLLCQTTTCGRQLL